MATGVITEDEVLYPDSDGEPIADNTIQFRWILKIYCGLERLFIADPNVFVAGNILWYMEEGEPKNRIGPDVLVAFGRPKGDRGSYKTWMEAGVIPQVVFEVLSPGNRAGEMAAKLGTYEAQGVEEYYVIDPYEESVEGYVLKDQEYQEVSRMDGWTSPRLGIRFENKDGRLTLYYPNGRPIEEATDELSRADLEAKRADFEARRAEEQARRAEEQARRAEEQARRADEQGRRADQEALKAAAAVRENESLRQVAADEASKNTLLLEKLRAAGIDPDSL